MYSTYLIGFDTGVVKAGMTSNLDRRLYQHRYEASKHGRRIVAGLYWMHDSREEAREAEGVLLAVLKRDCDEWAGKEYVSSSYHTAARSAMDAIDHWLAVPASVLNGENTKGHKYVIEGDRIRATRHMLASGVHAGDLGGVVWGPGAVSHNGSCWLRSGAELADGATIEGDVIVDHGIGLSGVHVAGSGFIAKVT